MEVANELRIPESSNHSIRHVNPETYLPFFTSSFTLLVLLDFCDVKDEQAFVLIFTEINTAAKIFR